METTPALLALALLAGCTSIEAEPSAEISSESATNLRGLRALRSESHFESWQGTVSERHVAASRTILKRLIDDVLALGPHAPGAAIEAAIDRAMRSFNHLDRGRGGPWIMAIERDDIAEALCRVADLAGLHYDREELLASRDW